MCKHGQTSENNKSQADTCPLEAAFNLLVKKKGINLNYSSLPHDDKGFCIFHSEDIDWKRANNFWEYFLEIIGHLDKQLERKNEKKIRFYDCHIVGKPDEFSIETAQKNNLLPTKINTIDLKNILLRSSLLFFNSTFHDPIHVERCVFKGGFSFHDCFFKEGINVFNSSISELSFFNSIFSKNLSFWPQNTFYDRINLLRNVFEEKIDFVSTVFRGPASIDENRFKNEFEPSQFNCIFEKGFTFRNNHSVSLIYFTYCIFYDNTLFFDNNFTDFHLENPLIKGSLAFVGTEESLSFNAHSIIELSNESFEDTGHVIFDYCNLLSLGNEFIANIKELELSQKVNIMPNCKINRLTIIYNYPYSKISQWFLADLAGLVQKYFDYYFSINLNIDIKRKVKQNHIQVIFKTSEKLSEHEFKERMGEFAHRISNAKNSEDIYEHMIAKTFSEISKRLNEAVKSNENLLKDPFNILTFNGDLAKVTSNNKQIESSAHGSSNILYNINKDALKSLIKKDRIKECLNRMEEYFKHTKNNEALNQLIAQTAIYNKIINQKRYELVTIFDYNREVSKVVYNLIEMIDDFI